MPTKAELLAEVKRLRYLLREPPELLGLEWDPKEGLNVEQSCKAVSVMATHFADILEKLGGENYLTMTIGGHERGPLEVTIRPCWTSKKTPAIVIGELKEKISQLEKRLGECHAAGQ